MTNLNSTNVQILPRVFCWTHKKRFLSEHTRAKKKSSAPAEEDQTSPFLLNEGVGLHHFEYLSSEEATDALNKESRANIENVGIKFRSGNSLESLQEVERKRAETVRIEKIKKGKNRMYARRGRGGCGNKGNKLNTHIKKLLKVTIRGWAGLIKKKAYTALRMKSAELRADGGYR